MAAVAKNPAFAKKAGVPAAVGQEFLNADKGRKFAKGGTMKETMNSMRKGVSKMGAVRTAAPSKDGIAAKGKTKGKQISMRGSKPMGMKMGGKACK
jgi:hypothetical protein